MITPEIVTLAIVTAILYAIAGFYRLHYESLINRKTVTSYQLERLSALEQAYVIVGSLFLFATIICMALKLI